MAACINGLDLSIPRDLCGTCLPPTWDICLTCVCTCAIVKAHVCAQEWVCWFQNCLTIWSQRMQALLEAFTIDHREAIH